MCSPTREPCRAVRNSSLQKAPRGMKITCSICWAGVTHPPYTTADVSSSPVMTQINHSCSIQNITFKNNLYATTYTIIFIPGLLANSTALWVLCRFISKKSKAVIFMINLAVADLAHVLSLPLRMYYYINHTWPFGNFLCQVCFYLKYLNMYASICFLTCISIQRYLFLLHPFKAKDWKRRYDAAISAAVWLFVGAACFPLLVVRSPALSKSTNTCFSDLGVKQLSPGASIAMVTVAELFGFGIPFGIIACCTWKMWQSLRECPTQLQNTSEKQKALRMVLMCAAVFFICFTPYHINFPFFMMVIENIIQDCTFHRSTLRFHPISLCLASLNCCLDPVLYYFMTSEFQDQLLRHSCAALRARFMRRGSNLSVTETGHDIRMKRRNLPRFKFWSLPKFFGRINSMEIPPMPPDELLLESIS